MIKNIVFSGGAIKGFSFIGVIQYLEECHALETLETCIGSSAGALISFLLCMGYSSKTIYTHCQNILKTYIDAPVDLNLVLNINETLGIDKGDNITGYLSKLIQEKWDNEIDITFIDFFKRTGYNLVVCASNLTTRQPVFFCVDHSPQMSVITAIRASITIPLVFTPLDINGELYVDAGVFNNYPIDFVQHFTAKDTLGVSIKSKEYAPHKPLHLFSYFRLMIDTVIQRANIKHNILNNIALLEIDGRDEETFSVDLNTLKLSVDMIKVEEYVQKGYSTATQSETIKVLLDETYLCPRKTNRLVDNFESEKHKKQKNETHSWVQIPPLITSQSLLFNQKMRYVFCFDNET